MTIEKIVLETINEILTDSEREALNVLDRGQIMLESGLDSMDFAILVAELENSLGFDPFVIEENPIYPSTFGEFIDLYCKHAN
jgi:acyl carrier protein